MKDTSDELTCVRDNATVSAEEPRCPHPSTVCPFRELCEVIDAIRKRRRAQASDENAAK
ncbi:MAG TPA: hypothetical protein VE890_16810 [Thermoguttaceae bacterium]|nr:hypothetical protein [Thermoguttaceae bacterium]